MYGLSKQEIKHRVKICTDTETELIELFRRMGSDLGKSFEDFMNNYGDFSDRLNIIYNRTTVKALTSNTPFARQFDERERENFSKMIPTTARRLHKYISETDGDIAEIIALSAWLFSPRRAETAARSVTNSLCGCEMFEKMKRRGYKYKEWHTIIDGKERLSHFAMNGKRVPIDEPFIVGGYRMMFPGDITYNPPLKEVINCRCTITPR